MLLLSVVFESNYIRSAGYGSMGCDYNDVWSFGGPGDDWYVLVYDIDWLFLG